MSLIMFRKDPFMLRADNFVNNPSCHTKSYAFLKSTKHLYILPLLTDETYLKIKDFNIEKKTISRQWSSLTQPYSPFETSQKVKLLHQSSASLANKEKGAQLFRFSGNASKKGSYDV